MQGSKGLLMYGQVGQLFIMWVVSSQTHEATNHRVNFSVLALAQSYGGFRRGPINSGGQNTVV